MTISLLNDLPLLWHLESDMTSICRSRVAALLTLSLGLMVLPGFHSSVSAQSAKKPAFGLNVPLFGNSSAAEAEMELNAELTPLGRDSARLDVTVVLPEGYHIYSMNPIQLAPTSIALIELSGLKEKDLGWTTDRSPRSGVDEFGDAYEKFFRKVTWSKTLQGSLKAGLTITGTFTGQYCGSGENGIPGTCIPVRGREFTATLDSTSSPSGASETITDSTPIESQDLNPITLMPEIGFGRAAQKGLIQFDIALTPEKPAVGQEVTLSIRAKVQDPWHTFALDQDPDMAGIPTTIELEKISGLTPLSEEFRPSIEPEIKQVDDIIQRIHHGEITWSRKYQMTDPRALISGSIQFQMCSNGSCLPPKTSPFELTLTAGATRALNDSSTTTGSRSNPDVTSPQDSSGKMAKDGLLAFLLTAIGAGFVALLTPCVFPMIPVTVAFFLKQEEKKAGSSLKLAIVYCLAMIGAFTVLGLIGAALFGPAALNQLANNKWLNVGFGVLFLFFGFMLLGVFELQIPSWLLTWTSRREATGGLLGVVFMALTFTLVSFTCTFAFVGSLLVIAAQGDYFWPIVGMLGFSTAFASPFFVLAMFPAMLKKLPRSGGWMNEVKVVIGLVEIAAAVKFISVADIGFSVGRIPVYVTYPVFMAVWIILALIAGIYLLGLLRKPRPTFSAVRYASATIFLVFAARLIAGVSGLQLPNDPVWNLVAAFAPPDVNVHKSEELGYVISHHRLDFALDFDKAVKVASKNQTPMFVDFTGVNCVNCRQMERTVMMEREVVEVLRTLVCAQLYTDEVPGITDKEVRDTLRDTNIALQSDLVADVTLPNYAIVSADGKTVLSVFKGLDTTGGTDFLAFLRAGLDRWEQMKEQQVAVGEPLENR
jgi:thiol:disulfide interchange protein